MDKNQEAYLTEKFGRRVNFDEMERRLYSHDVGAPAGTQRPSCRGKGSFACILYCNACLPHQPSITNFKHLEGYIAWMSG